MPFSGPKWLVCPEQHFFGMNHYYYPLALFIVQKLKQNSYSEPRVMRMRHLWAKKGSFAPNKNFSWKKLLISFSSTYWPLSFCKILKKLFEPIHSCEDVPFSGPKYPNFSWTKFFVPNHYYYFHLPIGPFNWAKFKKYSDSESRVMKMHHFWAQDGPFAPNKNFFWNKLLISF